jgi:hypothetical protein
MSLMIAGAALAGLVGKASAQYTLTTDVAVPFYSGDGVTGSTTTNSTSSASAFVKYTGLTLSNLFPTSSVPNGTYTSPLLGTLTGSQVSNSSVGVSTGWAYDPTEGFRLVGYYSESSTGAHSAPTMKGANSLGVIGYSSRASAYNTSNSLLGQDAWFYNNATGTNTTLGLTGAGFGYTYQNSIGQVFGTYQSSTPNYLNTAGQIAGTSSRYAGIAGTGGGGSLGTSAWIQSPAGTPTEIGLNGLGYNYFVSGTVSGYNSSGAYTTSAPYSGTTYSEGVNAQDSSGDVIGTAQSYYNTGLGGNSAAAINSSGGVTGAYTALGQDGWFYNHANGATTAVGLYWSTLTPMIAGSQFASLNSQLAYSNIPAATKPVGSSPSNSTYRTTSVYGISTTGQVVGTSGYFNTSSTATNALGTDAFVYSPTTGSYTTIGLVSNSFTTIGYPQTLGQTSFVNPFGARASTVNAMNDHNLIVGTSTVYVGVGTGNSYVNQGQAAWIANASTGITTQIGLWNQSTSIHVCNNANQAGVGVYDDYITSMTESGFVAGYSNRYNASNGSSFGSDAWVYDSSKGITFPVDPADESNGAGYTSSSILYLSESGVAVGEYKDNSSFSAPYSAFIWSESGGFADLGSNVTLGGLSAAGYQGLIAAYYSDPGGDTLYATASLPGTPTTVSAVVTLTGTVPVPEPASVALLAVGGSAALLRRRRRVASVV